MRQRRISVDRVLRKVMFLTGLILGLALARRYFLSGSSGQSAEAWAKEGKTWLAQEIVQWIRWESRDIEEVMDRGGASFFEMSGAQAESEETAAGKTRTWKAQLSQWIGTWLNQQNPVLDWILEHGEEEQPLDFDPAYSRYLAQQEVMKESAYLLLFGDENSNLSSTQLAGNGTFTEDQNGRGVGAGQESGANQGVGSGQEAATGQEGAAAQNSYSAALAGTTPAYHIREMPATGKTYVLQQLMDYDFLMKHFYNVHSSTTASRDEMNARELLQTDLSLTEEQLQQEGPQILIYHTHSQETYADYSAENPDANVVGIGNYLTELLQQKGYQVYHDTSVYDLVNGQLDRNHAYNYALDGITGILQKYPSIQVILDVHRDGVSEGLHMVSEVNGKSTAPIMFFNGMSQTPEGPIEYLQNPYKKENLAFSLQMQLDAAAYYPGLTRKIYLKGLRYNLHLRPRSALIEVGAQTNTYQEALNAMEPLAEVLDMVLSGADR